jgi:hypothetical protein
MLPAHQVDSTSVQIASLFRLLDMQAALHRRAGAIFLCAKNNETLFRINSFYLSLSIHSLSSASAGVCTVQFASVHEKLGETL